MALGRQDLLLGGDIARHPAMAVEMVWRDVEQDGDVGQRRRRDVELVGRQLQHIDAVEADRRQRQGRLAEIAPHLDAAPGGFQHMGNECRRRRLAVGSRDADKACLRLRLPQQLDVGDDRLACRHGRGRDRMRCRKCCGNAGAHQQRIDGRPVSLPEVEQDVGRCRRARRFGIVPGQNPRARPDQRFRRRSTGTAEPQHRIGVAGNSRNAEAEVGHSAPTSTSRWRGRSRPG